MGKLLVLIAALTAWVPKHDSQRRPACPSVYVQTQTGWRFAGDILQNALAPRIDTLELGSASGALTIELRDVKGEKTFLDSIELDLDGVTVQPVECGRACRRDERFEVIGDARMFRFTWREPSARRVTLRVSGYVPRHITSIL